MNMEANGCKLAFQMLVMCASVYACMHMKGPLLHLCKEEEMVPISILILMNFHLLSWVRGGVLIESLLQGRHLREKVHEPPGLGRRKIYEPSSICMSPTLYVKLAFSLVSPI